VAVCWVAWRGTDLVQDGGFTVLIPSLGCATEGDTIEEAQANAVEAAEGWLTSQHKRMKDEAIRATQG
jgi:predicted RNase H-like HicB family nuclease